MAQLFANNASGKLLNAITAASTSLLLQAGQGEKFPVAVWPDYFKVTLEDAAKNVEVVRVTRAAGSDTLVVVDAAGANNTGGRGLEGTTARAFAASDVVELRLTAEALNDFSNKVSRAGDSMTGPLTLSGDATQALHAVPKQQMDAADALKASKGQNETISGNWTFTGGVPITVQNGSPAINWRDTDLAVNANGLWQLAIANGAFQLIKNTAAAGDFSTFTTPLQVDANGKLTLLGDMAMSQTLRNTRTWTDGYGTYELRATSAYIRWSDAAGANNANDLLFGVGGTAGHFDWYKYTGSGWQKNLNLDPSGNLTATGNVTAYSDRRLKTDIQTITFALDKVCRLRGVSYVRQDTGEAGVGVIAQEVQEVMPEVVQEHTDSETGETTLSVAYGNLVGLLIEAIKELRAEVDSLKEQLHGR